MPNYGRKPSKYRAVKDSFCHECPVRHNPADPPLASQAPPHSGWQCLGPRCSGGRGPSLWPWTPQPSYLHAPGRCLLSWWGDRPPGSTASGTPQTDCCHRHGATWVDLPGNHSHTVKFNSMHQNGLMKNAAKMFNRLITLLLPKNWSCAT